jgi:hypothetical protein
MVYLLVFTATLVTYSITLPRTITLEDAGLFQMVCHLGGISHPPGYPFFTLLCQGALPLFPGGVLPGNFLSAVFASAACAVFYACVRQMTDSQLTGIVGALALGFSATFWSQAIIIEVYSLAVLGYVVCWRLLLAYVSNQRPVHLYLASFCFGLSLANHWPLIILSAPALLMTLFPVLDPLRRHLSRISTWLIGAGCFAAGLFPYLSILLVNDPVISLLGSVESLPDLLRYIARTVYADADSHVIADSRDRVAYLLWIGEKSLLQFGVAGVPLVALGILSTYRTLPRYITVQLIVLLAGTTLLLNGLLNFSNEHLYRAVFEPYLVISCIPLAFWFARGSALAWTYARNLVPRSSDTAIAGMIVAVVFIANFSINDRSRHPWVENYGRALLASLPADAVYFADDEFETGVLGYLHYVEGVRPDVELRSWGNQFFPNRLTSPVAPASLQQSAMEQFLAGNQRPVFSASASLYPREWHGPYFRYTASSTPSAVAAPEFDHILDHLLDLYTGNFISDPHELNFAYHCLINFTRQYATRAVTQSLDNSDLLRLQRLQSTFPGKLAILEVLLQFNSPDAKARLEELANQAVSNIPTEAPRQSQGLIYEYLGRIALLPPADKTLAATYFKRSLEIYPASTNLSLCLLLTQLDQAGKNEAASSLRQDYPGAHCKQAGT